MIHKNIKLSTSNKQKIEEFKSFGLTFAITEGKDLKEIADTSRNVIIHKALDSGEGILVEDTVLLINGKEVVDIRWKIKELSTLKNPIIQWVTSLAILDNGKVYVYTGETDCSLIDNAETLNVPDDAFGFDPYLVPSPNGFKSPYTFYELKKRGEKSMFSPRKFATEALLNGIYSDVIDASTIPAWEGDYQ